MKAIRNVLDKLKPHFEKGGKYEKFHYLFEAQETFLFVPNHTTKPRGTQIKDAIDLKRLMVTVIIALIPSLIFGIWNVGYQHFLATGISVELWDEFLFGCKIVLPIIFVSYASGLTVEGIFSIIRKHPVNEGFLVTGLLIPLIMPVTIPLWQVALGTIFAVVIGKEVFGGTGFNILNPALTARAFLFFSYPSQMSGEVWTKLGEPTIEGYSGATPLGLSALTTVEKSGDSVLQIFHDNWLSYSFENLFYGTVPGSIGETSTLMSLIGAFILIGTGVASWRIILSMFVGGLLMGYIFNIFAVNPFMEIPSYYHLVIGGFAFGAVFMATDPVSAAQTNTGKWIYGFLIGFLAIFIRVLNPAYPEGVMLAILLMNVFAPLIDYYVIDANKKRRLKQV